MKKLHWLLAMAITGLAVTTSAQARDSFSLGISIGNPYYYAPPPVYYNPPPVVYYNVPQVYYSAPAVVYTPYASYSYINSGHHGYRDRGHRWDGSRGRGNGHWHGNRNGNGYRSRHH